MEIKTGDYVKYKDKIYSVAQDGTDDTTVDLISYKGLEILRNIPKSEVERLTDFHVSVMRFNKSLPPRRFREGDIVKLRAGLDSECVYNLTFSYLGFETGERYNVNRVNNFCRLKVYNCKIHEFEVELV